MSWRRWNLCWLIVGFSVTACGGNAPSTLAFGPLGQRIEAVRIALTVNSAEKLGLIGERSTPGPGNTFLVAEVKIENRTEYKISYHRYQFTLVGADGKIYDPLAVPGERNPLQASQLDPQKDVIGSVIFKVPAETRDLVLRYQPPGTVQTIEVDLKVES